MSPCRSALRNPTVSFSAIEDVVSEDFRSSTTSSSYHTASSGTPTASEFFSTVCSDDEDDEFFEVEDSLTPRPQETQNGSNNNVVSAERLSNKIKALQVNENPSPKFHFIATFFYFRKKSLLISIFSSKRII